MDWFYSTRYWKHSTDIFKNSKDFLEYKEGYRKNYRMYYGVSSKEALFRRIYKDYLNMAIKGVTDGDIVSLNKGVTLFLREKFLVDSPYTDIHEKLATEDMMPYIYMNTGEMSKINREFMIIPSKEYRKKLKGFKVRGKTFTKLFGKYFK